MSCGCNKSGVKRVTPKATTTKKIVTVPKRGTPVRRVIKRPAR